MCLYIVRGARGGDRVVDGRGVYRQRPGLLGALMQAPATVPSQARPSADVQRIVNEQIAAAGGLVAGGRSVSIDVDLLFTQTEDGTFTAMSFDEAVATAEITPNPHVVITPIAKGKATIQVSAEGEGGEIVRFEVTVSDSVPVLPLVVTGLLGMLLFGSGAYPPPPPAPIRDWGEEQPPGTGWAKAFPCAGRRATARLSGGRPRSRMPWPVWIAGSSRTKVSFCSGSSESASSSC